MKTNRKITSLFGERIKKLVENDYFFNRDQKYRLRFTNVTVQKQNVYTIVSIEIKDEKVILEGKNFTESVYFELSDLSIEEQIHLFEDIAFEAGINYRDMINTPFVPSRHD